MAEEQGRTEGAAGLISHLDGVPGQFHQSNLPPQLLSAYLHLSLARLIPCSCLVVLMSCSVCSFLRSFLRFFLRFFLRSPLCSSIRSFSPSLCSFPYSSRPFFIPSLVPPPFLTLAPSSVRSLFHLHTPHLQSWLETPKPCVSPVSPILTCSKTRTAHTNLTEHFSL